MDALASLQMRNNVLKSKLLHEMLRHGNFYFNTFRKEQLLVLHAYKTHKSLFKAADSAGVDKSLPIKWFVQGLFGNPQFRGFYLAISRMNGYGPQIEVPEVEEIVKNYSISEFDNAWTYTTEIDGEKISLISGDLDNLRELARSKDLPID